MMSDPVSNMEIEDVLSSIRRLISTDDRHAMDVVEEEDVAADKLVLTPSLRVDNAPTEPVKTEPESVEPTSEDQDTSAASDAQADQDETDPQDSSHDAQDVWQDDDTPDTSLDEAEAQDAAKAAEPADEDEDEAAAQDAQADNASQEAETVVDTKPQEEATHEGSLKETADDDAPEDDAPEDDAPVETAAEETAAKEAAPKDKAPDFAFASGRLHALTARAAEFETAVAAREDHWDPDGTTDDDNNATQLVATLPWLDHSPDEDGSADDTSADDTSADPPLSAKDTEGLDPFVPEEDDADEANFYAEDDPAPTPKAPGNAFMAEDDLLEEGADTFLDDDALRDLVSEIVRQELQGSLGERITRNVRKLVRREIQRALAAQELE